MKKLMMLMCACTLLANLLAFSACAHEVKTQESNGEEVVSHQTEAVMIQEEVTSQAGVTVTVEYPEELASFISEEEIKDIILEQDLSNGARIILWDVGTSGGATPAYAPPARTPLFQYSGKKTKTASNVVLAKKFLLSVARGQTVSLSVERKFSCGTSFAPIIPYSTVQFAPTFDASVNAVFTVGYTFTGPGNFSTNNSRSYYVHFMGDKYNWTQTKTNIRDGYQETRSGTASCPTIYKVYAIDEKI